MKGADLECECGAGAIDVAPDLTLNEMGAVSWHCANGHLNISGARPGHVGFQQLRLETTVPGYNATITGVKP